MRQRILLLLIALTICLHARATHIVGGEFELQHLTGFNYRLTLNLYFDDVNGNPDALDQSISVTIFEKGTNRQMMAQVMTIKKESYVPYTNIDCTVGFLRTRKIVYYENIFLDPSRFNNPAGYYVTWERCCRNNTINNIVNPQDAAQTFYMEFPPVTQNGSFFRNSSPILFPPLSDYACVGELFYFDFNGTDPDGDSLVYDMVTPLNGFTTPGMPVYTYPPRPAPYPEVRWLAGYSTATQVKGSPPINIDRQTGQLTMRPAQKGLFVFGIRCQEFRNGVKIGEVRRDFQVLVLDCPQNQSPVVVAKEQNQDGFYNAGEILRIGPSSNRCIEVYFTDPDKAEFVSLRARPVNFSRQDYTLQGITSGVINQGSTTDSLKVTLCFEECFDTEGKVYQMDLIVQDDGCSLPRQDTVRLNFVIEPIQNAPPTVSLSTTRRVFEVQEGDIINFDVLGTDPDEDAVTLSAVGQNFNLSSQKISFQNKSGVGQVSSPFQWEIDCSAMSQESYTLDFVVSTTVCDKTVTRTETIEVRPKLNNNTPVISSDKQVLSFELNEGELFEAKLFGTDLDKDQLTLLATGAGFNLTDLGMNFSSTGGAGAAEGLFTWVATCTPNGPLRVTFSLKEDNCRPAEDQTLTMEFTVRSTNNAPMLTSDKEVLVFELALNEPFEAKLLGEDIDQNLLTLSATGDGFTLEEVGMNFASKGGNGNANGEFKWVANCAAFERGILRVTFNLKEDACSPAPDQQITMEFRVKVPELADYVPANIFTPNGDGLNDYFEIPAMPAEFCTATFANIRIFNRWGKEVYSSTDNKFKWDGKGMNDGVYFYVIDYRTTTYKGSVTLVR